MVVQISIWIFPILIEPGHCTRLSSLPIYFWKFVPFYQPSPTSPSKHSTVRKVMPCGICLSLSGLFPLSNALRVHSCCCKWQDFLLSLGCVTLHCIYMYISHFYPFMDIWVVSISWCDIVINSNTYLVLIPISGAKLLKLLVVSWVIRMIRVSCRKHTSMGVGCQWRQPHD